MQDSGTKMPEGSEPSDEEYYEIEIDGVVHRVSRKKTEDLADRILHSKKDAEQSISDAFRNHPDFEPDVEVTIDPDELKP
jgi:hypothetical protein